MTCCLVEGKLALPSNSLGDPGKRCMEAIRRNSIPSTHSTALGSPYTVHDRSEGSLGSYYVYDNNGRFLSTDNLSNREARLTFERLANSIAQCSLNHVLEADHSEAVIILRCISGKTPKMSYYIVNHTDKTIHWAHERAFRDHEDLYDVPMRNNAEYWDHRSRFYIHQRCSQSDYDELNNLLNSIPMNGPDAPFNQASIDQLKARLVRDAADPNSVQGTFAIADIHARVLKAQLRGFYEPDLTFGCRLLKSLGGLVNVGSITRSFMRSNPRP